MPAFREDANKELDLLKWKADIEAEVEEERMFFNMEHQVALAKYKFEHEQWAKQEAKMVSRNETFSRFD